MNKLISFTNENEIQINCKKTKVMLFNTSTNRDFQPEIIGEDGNLFDVEEEVKLLGVKVTSGLK